MRWLSAFAVAAVLLASAVFVAPARAQDQASPNDMYVDESAGQTQTVFKSLRDFGSFGGSLGLMKVFGGDLGADAQLDPILQGNFRYRFSDKWVGVADFGFGWNSFKAKGDTVLTFTFGVLGVARSVARPLDIQLRAGAGLGFYRWNYKFAGQSLRDPQTFRFYRGMVPGGYLGFEGERRITSHVTLNGTIRDHFVLTSDSSKFNVIFDQNYSFMDFRVGLNYYFSPFEGILWESKKTQRVRMESGRTGR